MFVQCVMWLDNRGMISVTGYDDYKMKFDVKDSMTEMLWMNVSIILRYNFTPL